MIGYKIAIFAFVFIIGELLVNKTWFNYVKDYFKDSVTAQESAERGTSERQKTFIYLNLSTFKGLMERFVLSVCLISGFPPILIAFGALKISTRLGETKNVKNDYFLIGNLSSIIIAVMYYHCVHQLYILFKIIPTGGLLCE